MCVLQCAFLPGENIKAYRGWESICISIVLRIKGLTSGKYINRKSRYCGVDKSLARPGRKQARKHVRDTHDFNIIDTRAVIEIFFFQGKTPNEIAAILTETSACFLPGRAKDLSAPLYVCSLSLCVYF